MARLSRRQALAGFGSVSLGALLAACGADDDPPESEVRTTDGTTSTVQTAGGRRGLAGRFDEAGTCSRTAEQSEGPFYFDVDSIRSDIREDREGAELRLGIRVRGGPDCEPVPNAVVHVWHCDAAGVYSGFDAGAGEKFLRGAQVTDRDGIVEFTTIYPGAYVGRTVHIHAKVHLDTRTALTTQLYFDDGFTARVYESAAYAPAAEREVLNADDALYDRGLELTLSEESDGYLGLITLDVA